MIDDYFLNESMNMIKEGYHITWVPEEHRNYDLCVAYVKYGSEFDHIPESIRGKMVKILEQ